MKRKLIALLAALVLLTSLSAAASADGAALLCSAEELPDGSYGAVVELNGAAEAVMLQFTLRYDPEQLSVFDVQFGNIFAGNQSPTVNARIPGEIHLIWDSLQPLGRDGAVLVLRLQRSGSRTTALSFDPREIIVAMEDFSTYDVAYTDYELKGMTAEEEEQPASTPTETPRPSPPAATVEVRPTEVPGTVGNQPTVTPSAPQPSVTPSAPQPTVPPDTPQPTETRGTPQSTFAAAGVLLEGTSDGLTMTESRATVNAGETKQMEVLEKETELNWSSSNEQIATVDSDGVVTTHRAGTVLITASSLDGEAYASSVITVEGEETPLATLTETPAQEAAEKAPESVPTPAPEQNPSPTPDTETEKIESPTGQESGHVSVIVISAVIILAACLTILLAKKKKSS